MNATDQRTEPKQLDATEIDRLRLALVRIVRGLRSQTKVEVTPSQLAILSTLARHGPLSVSEIATRENVKSPSVSRIAGALADAGLVVRTTDEDDRRVSRLAVTDAGHDAMERIRTAGRSWLRDHVTELDPSHIELLRAALPALEALLDCTAGRKPPERDTSAEPEADDSEVTSTGRKGGAS